jgi:hypothetical protein
VALAGGNRCQEKRAVLLGERDEIAARDTHAGAVQVGPGGGVGHRAADRARAGRLAKRAGQEREAGGEPWKHFRSGQAEGIEHGVVGLPAAFLPADQKE